MRSCRRLAARPLPLLSVTPLVPYTHAARRRLSTAGKDRKFRVLGVQQVAIGSLDKCVCVHVLCARGGLCTHRMTVPALRQVQSIEDMG